MKKLLKFIPFAMSYLLYAVPTYAQKTETVDILSKIQGGGSKNFFGFTCITHIVFRIVDISIILAGLMLFAYLVWGGIEWLTSGGDKGKIENARNKLTSALIGVAIIAASYAAWQLALVFFGIDLSAVCTENPIPGGI